MISFFVSSIKYSNRKNGKVMEKFFDVKINLKYLTKVENASRTWLKV